MSFARSTVLFGRDREMARLHAAADLASEGTARLAVVEGEPGIGKTRLARELAADLASRPAPPIIATGHGVELADGVIPFGTVAGLLQDLVAEVGTEQVAELLGHRASELAPLVPWLETGQQPAFDRLRVFGAARHMLSELCRDRLVVLFVEDMHWSDLPSVDLVSWLARRVTGRLLLVLTVRPIASLSSEVSGPIVRMGQLDHADWLTVPVLGDDDVERQVVDVVGGEVDRQLLSRVQELSAGVPLYVEELLAAAETGENLLGAVPARLRLNLTSRLSTLDQPIREVLGAASLEPTFLTVDTIAEVVGQSREAVWAALDAAVARGILDPLDHGRFRFHHALLRNAVADSLPTSFRVDWHRRWAQTLGEPLAADRPDRVITVAEHWWAAGLSRAAVEACGAAARMAERLGAPIEAIVYWRRVVDLIGDNPVLGSDAEFDEALARMVLDSGVDAQLKKQLLLDVEPFVPASGLRRWWWQLSRTIAGTIIGDDVDVPTPDLMHQALVDLRLEPASTMQVMTLQLLVRMSHLPGIASTDVAEEAATIALRSARELEDARLVAHVSTPRFFSAWEQGDLDGALAQALELAELCDPVDRSMATFYRSLATGALFARGDLDQAARLGNSTLAALPDHDLDPSWTMMAAVMVQTFELAGEWDRAEAMADEFLAHTNWSQFTHTVQRIRALIAIRRGDDSTAQSMLDALRTHVPEVGTPLWETGFTFSPHLVAAELAAAGGDREQARHQLRVVLDQDDLAKETEVLWVPVVEAARLAAVGEAADEEWSGLVRHAAAQLFRWGAMGEAWSADVDANLARAERNDSPQVWEAAVAAWERVGAPYEEAVCRLRWAEALVRERQNGSATGQLAASLSTSQQLGATRLADEVLQVAGRARIRLAGHDPGPRTSGLTPRELEVLQLLAEGRTNDEIGRALFMSPKTASVHVSHIIAKLGATNRTEVATLAHRRGLIT